MEKQFVLHVVLFQRKSYFYSERDRSGKIQLVKRTGADDCPSGPFHVRSTYIRRDAVGVASFSSDTDNFAPGK